MFTIKRGAFVFIAALVALCSAAGALTGGIAATYATAAPVIVIDAGHGGIDVGVCGTNTGVKESDINLSIAEYLREYFVNAGFTAVLTRKTQAGLYGLPTKGFKLRDMQARRKIIEDCSADMVISVHQNFYSDSKRQGSHVFFKKGSESGKELAVSIQQKLNALNGQERNSPLLGDYYMLECTESPSVIVECGFLSNAEDEAMLCTEEYKKLVAYAIFSGAVSYFS